MKVLKYLVLSLLALIFIIISSGIVIAYFFQDEVAQYAIKELNKHLATEIKTEKVKFSVLKRFPNASLEFQNIVAKSTSGLRSEDFGKVSTDTLFQARSLFLEFNIISLFNKNYTIKSILMSNGKINLFIDKQGKVNYKFWKPSSDTVASRFSIKLKSIKLDHVQFLYHDVNHDFLLGAFISKGKLQGDFNEKEVDIVANISSKIGKLSIAKFEYINKKDVTIGCNIRVANNKMSISNGIVGISKTDLNVNGSILFLAETAVDLRINGKDIAIANFEKQFPSKIREYYTNYENRGKLDFEMKINGKFGNSSYPHLETTFKITDGQLNRMGSNMKLDDIELSGQFSNGTNNSKASSVLSITHFNGKLKGNSIDGSGKLTDLDNTSIQLNLKSKLDLAALHELVKLDTIQSISGIANADISLEGKLSLIQDFSLKNFSELHVTGNFDLHGINLLLKGYPNEFTNINGKLLLKNDMSLENLSFKIAGNDFLVNGKVSNAVNYLISSDQDVFVDANVISQKLDLNTFKSSATQKSKQAFPISIIFPERVFINFGFEVGNFSANKFKAKNFQGNMCYKPKMFTLKSVSLETMTGKFTGNGAIVQKMDKGFLVQCQSKLHHIDINKLFYTFDNFGQTFILDKHLKGNISGSVNFSSEWTANMSLIPDKIVAESTVDISNGELIDFKPLMGLSKYINMTELMDIKFSNLKNEIYIKDSKVIIPQMDISSSALNISGSGIQQFDGHFSYKITLILNEILAKKFKSKKVEKDEFDNVEDDGLGKIKLYYSIDGTADDLKVKLDLKKSRDVTLEKMKNEKKQLKALLHDEFGLFKKDSTLNGDNKDKKAKKFKVQWDEDYKEQPVEQDDKKKTNTKKANYKVEWKDE
jgi:hypothetical protein